MLGCETMPKTLDPFRFLLFRVAYDRDFLIFTLPTTRKGTAKIIAGRGMKLNHLYYWSEHFRNPAWESVQAPVRYDPFDIGTAFAFVDRQWVECHSEHYAMGAALLDFGMFRA
jgi:putative transposase